MYRVNMIAKAFAAIQGFSPNWPPPGTVQNFSPNWPPPGTVQNFSPNWPPPVLF